MSTLSSDFLSLEEIKRIRRTSEEDMSLEDIIKLQKVKLRMKERESISSASSGSGVDANSDINKSLDEIVKERNIPKPTKYGPVSITSERKTVPVKAKTEVKLRKLDPRSHSLDEIIDKKVYQANGVKEEEVVAGPSSSSRASQKRSVEGGSESDSKRGGGTGRMLKRNTEEDLENARDLKHITTPYRALNLLSEHGILIELCIGKLLNGDRKHEHLWRCIIMCGELKSVCDSVRKVVAREMASHHFLESLKGEFPADFIPPYEIPDELFIDPRVFHKLEAKCNENSIQIGHETRLISSKYTNFYGKVYPVYTFQCKYIVGNEEFEATSVEEKYAKLAAAKKALEFVTNSKIPPTKYFVGDECDDKLEHVFNESMACQVIGKDDMIDA